MFRLMFFPVPIKKISGPIKLVTPSNPLVSYNMPPRVIDRFRNPRVSLYIHRWEPLFQTLQSK